MMCGISSDIRELPIESSDSVSNECARNCVGTEGYGDVLATEAKLETWCSVRYKSA